jgi:hypothetical protein
MKKTVREIIQMINDGKLHYDQSTQRNFIYTTMSVKTDDGDLTRAGNVIRSILQYDIQLPALYFWDLGNGQYNIHDGKQRILSIVYFINPIPSLNVITRLNGRETGYSSLTNEEKEKLLNYEFDIVVKAGTPEQEEQSFYMINTNSVALTDYESLRGMFHGTWIYEFEQYIDQKHKVLDKISRIGRGEQAILFLYSCFDLNEEKLPLKKIIGYLRGVRNNSFVAADYKMEEIIIFFNTIVAVTSISSESAVQVSTYIIRKGWDKDLILDYYKKTMKQSNDVAKWKIDTHKTAINKLIQENIECDGKRFFTAGDKDIAYNKSKKCSFNGCNISNFSELEQDHRIAWSNGGKTIIDNLQLLCKSHNASKGADEDGVKG